MLSLSPMHDDFSIGPLILVIRRGQPVKLTERVAVRASCGYNCYENDFVGAAIGRPDGVRSLRRVSHVPKCKEWI